ncbi:hypothetical protein K439DRAFT_1627016 [Ramaria rubella]|nr:hypothetical protein K439DRAFT_1627016 [Ramaria rubella]
MLSLTRTLASRVPFAVLRSTGPIPVQCAYSLTSLIVHRALSTSSSSLFPPTTRTRVVATRSVGRSKTTPGKQTNPKTKPKPKVKANAKSKPKSKSKPKPKTKRKVVVKRTVSTLVPLAKRPPKKPPTAFFIFYRRMYPSLSANPGNVTTKSKECATAWGNLTDAEKKPFFDEWKALTANYIAERDKWHNDPKNAEVFRMLNKDRKKRGKHRLHRPAGLQGRPISGYIRFVQDLRKANKLSFHDAPEGTSPLVWVARESAARWKALPTAQKENYLDAYRNDYKVWKASQTGAGV